MCPSRAEPFSGFFSPFAQGILLRGSGAAADLSVHYMLDLMALTKLRPCPSSENSSIFLKELNDAINPVTKAISYLICPP